MLFYNYRRNIIKTNYDLKQMIAKQLNNFIGNP